MPVVISVYSVRDLIRRLLPGEGYLEGRHESSSAILGAQSFGVCNEVDVHAVRFWLRVEIDLDLGEQAHGFGRETERDDAGDSAG